MPEALTPANIRERLLEGAGLDFARQSALLRRAVEVCEAALDARSQLNPDLPDFFARLRAVHIVLNLLGAMPSKTLTAGRPAPVIVNVDIPDWARPMLRERTVRVVASTAPEAGSGPGSAGA